MSQPFLQLCIRSSVPRSEISAFLGVDIEKLGPVGVHFSQVESVIGRIAVYVHVNTSQQSWEFRDFGKDWNLILDFRCDSYWYQMQALLVLRLYEYLVRQYPGDYLAVYDTGEVLFYGHEGILTFNTETKGYWNFLNFDDRSNVKFAELEGYLADVSKNSSDP